MDFLKNMNMTQAKNKIKKTVTIITHDGSFHADDVFACAALSLMLEKRGQKFKVVRTRDRKIIADGDYVFDVGSIYDSAKNRFDHHQTSFQEKRKNGIQYSSFGLVWKKYGKVICKGEEVKEYMDKLLVEQIDATDNGMKIFKPTTNHFSNFDISSVVASFLPAWEEKETPKHFFDAVKFAKHILEKEIMQFKALIKAKKIIAQSYQKSNNKKLLIIERDIPRYLVDIASNSYKKVIYIIFKDEKNWKVLAVRKTAGTFGNKKNLPKAWAGLEHEKLQKVTGVSDAVFCHRGLFLAVAKSKIGALKLAKLALLAPSH